ncbi:hypothetical protein ACPCG0_02350 [Propionibacteriaceae bacterium Y1923]|uniref:hypothetical protein n=1 Tax=Aestuariimicrobium sp. Y1814 TaxID=3418742 RepID=UPI003C1D5B48
MIRSLVPLHGVGSRQDLPLPFELVVAGAAVTLAVTFVALLWAWRSPRWAEPGGRALPRLTRLVDHPALLWTGRVLVAGLLAIALLALVAGPDLITNPFPGFLFVWVWIGLVPVSLLFGQVWRRLSPVRSLLAWRGAHREDAARPDVAGLYPAAAALLGFTWLELVQPDRATTAVLKWWVLAFAVWAIGGALLRGGRWITSADPFEAYATTVARLSPWQRRDGVLQVTNPLRHLSSTEAPRGLWAVCCVLLGGTAFDSLSGGVWWVRATQSSEQPAWLWGSLGLLGCLAVVVATYLVGALVIDRASGSRETERDLNSLGRSLVPIVVGYALAHYATLLVIEGQRVAINLSDPLGRGQNWFGTAELGVNGAIYDYASAVAWAQVGFIVGGHVLGVACAHDIALRTLPAERRTWAQLPLLLVMVGYTCAGLLLLFA